MDAPEPDKGLEAISRLLRRVLLGIAVGLLAVLCMMVLRPFFAPILWAAILAYVTWPLYRRLRAPFRRFNSTAAVVMTLMVLAGAIAPLLWLLVLIQHELVDTYRNVNEYISHGPHELPSSIRNLPWAGSWLQDSLNRYARDPEILGRELVSGLQDWKAELAALLGSLGRSLGKALVGILTLFFVYRDGDALVRQMHRFGTRFFEDRLDRYIRAAGDMTRAVVYGFLITALAQGVIAGIGYRIIGLEAPVLLGALTGLLSAAPVLGTAFIWVPLAFGLVIGGHTWQGILLLAWGFLLVHPTDNVLRPLLISSVTRVPLLLVILGTFGGLLAFGLVGVFLGPVLLGVASALWLEWSAEGGSAHD